MRWSELRADAMTPGYKATNLYGLLTDAEKALVDALIEAQT